jgi:hypothetical protein
LDFFFPIFGFFFTIFGFFLSQFLEPLRYYHFLKNPPSACARLPLNQRRFLRKLTNCSVKKCVSKCCSWRQVYSPCLPDVAAECFIELYIFMHTAAFLYYPLRFYNTWVSEWPPLARRKPISGQTSTALWKRPKEPLKSSKNEPVNQKVDGFAKIPDPESRIPNSGLRIPGSGFRIPDPRMSTFFLTSYLTSYLTSSFFDDFRGYFWILERMSNEDVNYSY